MLPKNTKLSDLADAIGMPDQAAINNRNALKAKRYDEMLVEIATLEARIKELEAALESVDALVSEEMGEWHGVEFAHLPASMANIAHIRDILSEVIK